MTLSTTALAQRARETGILGVLDANDASSSFGIANLGVLRVAGSDAASFLHSQLTNDVTGLTTGMGNLTARVSRTGHLAHLASLHRVPDEEGIPVFLLISERNSIAQLEEDLDQFLFADDVSLSDASAAFHWIVLQGPAAAETATDAFGALGFEPWDSLPHGAVRPIERMRGEHPTVIAPGVFAVRRSLTGDVGFLIALPQEHPDRDAVIHAVHQAADTHDLEVVDPAAASAAIEVLRIETGWVRVGPDTPGKRGRLLPETGLEQSTVSYTKGCYLGQEVIARVRTYGSVPHLLRALVFDDASLDDLPPSGTPLHLVSGERAGVIVSRTWSPVANATIALAYLSRAHRTPGTDLELSGPNGEVRANVSLLPLYSAPDTAGRVAFLYDRAIRTFAAGQHDNALDLLEECLRLDPGFHDGYEAIGVMLGRAGRFHEAIDFFRRLEEVAPLEPMVNTNLSLYYMKLGDKETAEDEAARATEKNFALAAQQSGKEFDTIAYTNQREEADRRDASRKKAMFGQVLEFDPVDPIALFGLGAAHMRLGEYADAVDVLTRASEVASNNSAVYLTWGKALEELDRIDEATQTYRQGVEVASRQGDLMPLREMEHRLLLLGASSA